MPERYGEILPPGWGALRVLPARRRRRRWLGTAVVASVALAVAWMLWLR